MANMKGSNTPAGLLASLLASRLANSGFKPIVFSSVVGALLAATFGIVPSLHRG